MSLDTSTVRKFDETKDLDLMERINAFKQEAEQAPESALSFHTKLENTKAEDRLEQNLDESDPYTEFAKKYDVAALASAASFGGAVPALIEALYRNMLMTVEQNGEYSTTNGGGAIDPEANTAEERKAKKQEEAKKVTGGDVEDFIQDQRQQELDRQKQAMSQSALDLMEWEGDPNATWTFGNSSGSAASWYNAARTARQNLDQTAKTNNWSDKKKKEQDDALAKYQSALKKNDQAAAQKAWDQLDPEVKTTIKAGAENAKSAVPKLTAEEAEKFSQSRADTLKEKSQGFTTGNLASFDAKAFQEDNLHNYAKAIKTGDHESQAEAWENMDPSVRKYISDQTNKKIIESSNNEKSSEISNTKELSSSKLSTKEEFNEVSSGKAPAAVEVAMTATKTAPDYKADTLALM